MKKLYEWLDVFSGVLMWVLLISIYTELKPIEIFLCYLLVVILYLLSRYALWAC